MTPAAFRTLPRRGTLEETVYDGADGWRISRRLQGGSSVRTLTRTTIAAVISAALMLVGAAAVSAADEFGQHVKTCAQDPGLTGDHNPGMHDGAAGWDPSEACGTG